MRVQWCTPRIYTRIQDSFSYILTICQKLSNVTFFYAYDTYFFPQHKYINEIEKQLDKYFESICNWFVDNKLRIHFGDGKIKSILFATKFKIKMEKKLSIKYGDIQIKQYSKVNI